MQDIIKKLIFQNYKIKQSLLYNTSIDITVKNNCKQNPTL